MHRKADILKDPLTGQSIDFQDTFSHIRTRQAVKIFYVPPNHHLDQLILIYLAGFDGIDIGSIFNHSHPIAQLKNLLHAVGDIDNAITLFTQLTNHTEKELYFLVCQKRRRLVKHNDFCVLIDYLCNCNHFLLTDGQLIDPCLGIDSDIQFIERFLYAPIHGFPVHSSAFSRLATQEKVFRNC